MVFHNLQRGPHWGHVASTRATFERAVPCWPLLHLLPCWRGVSCGPPLEMMWTVRFLTCHPLLLLCTLQYVELSSDMSPVVANVYIAICGVARVVLGLADVQCDREMSCGTSCSTWTFNFWSLQFDALFCTTAYVVVECLVWHHIGHSFFLWCLDKT